MTNVIGLFASERREIAAYAASTWGDCYAEAAEEASAVASDPKIFRWWRAHRQADWTGYDPYQPQSHPGLPPYPRRYP
jgi:hypothetical protein